MKSKIGKRAFGYIQFQALKDIEPIIKASEPVMKEQDNEQLFDQIFTVNPRTLLPDGDIAVFMSENTSPEVRNYISNMLMNPLPDDASALPSGYDIDEETLVGLTRRSSETFNDYRSRVVSFLEKQKNEVEKQKNEVNEQK